jgi:hypothetical protein
MMTMIIRLKNNKFTIHHDFQHLKQDLEQTSQIMSIIKKLPFKILEMAKLFMNTLFRFNLAWIMLWLKTI